VVIDAADMGYRAKVLLQLLLELLLGHVQFQRTGRGPMVFNRLQWQMQHDFFVITVCQAGKSCSKLCLWKNCQCNGRREINDSLAVFITIANIINDDAGKFVCPGCAKKTEQGSEN